MLPLNFRHLTKFIRQVILDSTIFLEKDIFCLFILESRKKLSLVDDLVLYE